jgi:signal transduction histidine kinase
MLTLYFSNPEIQKEYNDQLDKCHKKRAIILSTILMIMNIINVLLFHFSTIENDYYKQLELASYITAGINFITLSTIILNKKYQILKACTFLNFILLGFTNFILRSYFSFYNFDALVISLIYTFQNFFTFLWYCTNTIDYFQGLVLTVLKGVALYSSLAPIVTPDKHFRFSIHVLVNLFVCFLSYIYIYERKKSFYYYKLMENRKGYYQNILENMNSGFLCISEDKVKFINKALLSNLNLKKYSSFKGLRLDDSIINISEQDGLCKLDLQHIFEELLDGIELSHWMKEYQGNDYTSISESIINYLKANSTSKFSVIGTNYVISESISVYYEISARYYKSSYNNEENIEFIFNDVSNIKIKEEINAEFKYKTMFLSKVAHEFKNPILCITELVDQVTDRLTEIKETTNDLDHKFKGINETLRSIKSMSNYLIILIKDMDFFSIKNLNITDINIAKDVINMDNFITFINDITNVLIKKFDKQGCIKFKIEQPCFFNTKIHADELRLKQILINLLSNSVKYTTNGEITLEINLDKDKLTFIVKDTGIGIPETKLRSLFQPFMPNSRNYTSISAGLGLFIVKEILELFGSKINYEPNEPVGSKFFFSIDITNTLYPSPEAAAKKVSSKFHSLSSLKCKLNNSRSPESKNTVIFDFQPRIPTSHRYNFTNQELSDFINSEEISSNSLTMPKKAELEILGAIIVVDDEILTRKSTVRILYEYCKAKGKNLDILEASDGIECLNLYYQSFKRKVKLLLIVSDQSMNFLNGSACAKILHDLNQEKGIADVPFYILTAYEQFALDSGIKGTFTKPLMNKFIEEMLISVNI